MRNAELSYSAKRWGIWVAGSVRVVLIFSLTLYKWCAIAVNLQRLAAMLRRCRIQKKRNPCTIVQITPIQFTLSITNCELRIPHPPSNIIQTAETGGNHKSPNRKERNPCTIAQITLFQFTLSIPHSEFRIPH